MVKALRSLRALSCKGDILSKSTHQIRSGFWHERIFASSSFGASSGKWIANQHSRRSLDASGLQVRKFSGAAVQKSESSLVTIPINGNTVKFDSVFLRDSCTCAMCVDISSSQKNFQTTEIPSDIQGSFVGTKTQDGKEVALVRWNHDIAEFPQDHQSEIPIKLLKRTVKGDPRRYINHFQPSNRVLWNNDTMSRDNIFIEYDQYISDDKVFFKALKQLESHGLVFLKNVPDCIDTDNSASINSIVGRMGPIRSTFYGLTWDVRSVPKAINVAYTNKFLGLHMDLCYLDLTPQFQFLHSMRARAPGGESIFSDSLRAAETIRKDDPELFKSLVEFPVTFHYYNDGQSYRQVRNTIELEDQNDLQSPIKLLNWSPPFQGPFAIDTGSKDDGKALRTFLEASKRFDSLISDQQNLYEYRMREGDCVIFDNRRVLHARRAFDPLKGERWLKGAYLDRDVFASKLTRLGEIHDLGIQNRS